MQRVAITGTSGRIGRALQWKLSQEYTVRGIDTSPASATTIIGDIRDYELLLRSFEGVDTVFHAAALHAPHVGVASEKAFYEINVEATEKICKAAKVSGVSQIIFTSTTALYGYANQGIDEAVWVNEQTVPQPKTIYHKTKLQAESVLRTYAGKDLSISVMRMSRCFPEPVNIMAVFRLHQRVDYRDVAEAHILAAKFGEKKPFDTYIISAETPFLKSDLGDLLQDPESVIRERQPLLAREFDERAWKFPQSIDRVYDSSYARETLGWKMTRGPMEVLKQYDDGDFEVLPPV